MAAKKKESQPRCKARKKKCSNCGHRFKGGDKRWKCPDCGTHRRCKNYAVKDYEVCRLHGARGGRPPSQKYVIASRIHEAYNRITEHPEIWEMTESMGMLGARMQELQGQLDEIETHAIDIDSIFSAISQGRKAMNSNKKANVYNAFDLIEAALMNAFKEQVLWEQIYRNISMQVRLSDSTKKWAAQNEQLISVSQFIEVLIFFQQQAFIFIPNAADRKRFVDGLRQIAPPDKLLDSGN